MLGGRRKPAESAFIPAARLASTVHVVLLHDIAVARGIRRGEPRVRFRRGAGRPQKRLGR